MTSVTNPSVDVNHPKGLSVGPKKRPSLPILQHRYELHTEAPSRCFSLIASGMIMVFLVALTYDIIQQHTEQLEIKQRQIDRCHSQLIAHQCAAGLQDLVEKCAMLLECSRSTPESRVSWSMLFAQQLGRSLNRFVEMAGVVGIALLVAFIYMCRSKQKVVEEKTANFGGFINHGRQSVLSNDSTLSIQSQQNDYQPAKDQTRQTLDGLGMYQRLRRGSAIKES